MYRGSEHTPPYQGQRSQCDQLPDNSGQHVEIVKTRRRKAQLTARNLILLPSRRKSLSTRDWVREHRIDSAPGVANATAQHSRRSAALQSQPMPKAPQPQRLPTPDLPDLEDDMFEELLGYSDRAQKIHDQRKSLDSLGCLKLTMQSRGLRRIWLRTRPTNEPVDHWRG